MIESQPWLEDERVLLRPLRPDDWEALHSVASDPLLWAQHPIHDRWQEPVFRTFFDEGLAAGGALLAIDKASGSVAGSSQIRACPIALAECEIGWTFLARAYWGTGFNRAMKRLMVRHALDRSARVLFRIGEANIRSRKALEAIGGTLVPDLVETGSYQGRAVRHVVYEITREGYARGPLADPA